MEEEKNTYRRIHLLAGKILDFALENSEGLKEAEMIAALESAQKTASAIMGMKTVAMLMQSTINRR